MLRHTLIATCLLIASGSAVAYDNYGPRHGVNNSPPISISFGLGSSNYDVSDRHNQNVYVPRHAQPVYNNSHYRGDGARYQQRSDHRNEWRNTERHNYGVRNNRDYREHD